MDTTTKFFKDAGERVVRTFIQGAGAAVAADWGKVANLDDGKKLAIAGIAAGFSAIMALLTRGFGRKDTASVVKDAA